MMVVLLGIAALALDFGRAYGVKAKLNAAVDVASIAAGRAAAQGIRGMQTQGTNAFNANFPSDLMGSTVTAPIIDPKQNPDGSWTINVTATATLPTSFAKVLGWQEVPVKASATSTVRTLDLILVLDSSGSLNNPAGTPDLLRRAAKNFIQKFDPQNDRIGLVHFAAGAVSDITITQTKKFNLQGIQDAIDAIAVDGYTASEEGMRRAKAQLDSIPVAMQNSLRVIVLFTDGAPNTIACNFGGTFNPGDLFSDNYGMTGPATEMLYTDQVFTSLGTFNGATLPNSDYTGTVNLRSDLIPPTRILDTIGTTITNTKCNVNRAARNMLENVANAARGESPTTPGQGKPILIYAIGLGDDLTKQEVQPLGTCGYGNSEFGQNILLRLANTPNADTYNKNQPSGLYAYAADGSQLNAAFQQVANQILRLTQ